jgi:hypothetical protein
MLAIYIFAPFVSFGAVSIMTFDAAYLALPFLAYGISLTVTVISYHFAGKIWQEETRNLVGMASVSGNTMYFGLPLVMAVMGDQWVGVYMMMNLGALFGESTIGYYLAARGKFSVKQSMIRVLKLPIFYGVFAGFFVNLMGWSLPDVVLDYWNYTTGAWVLVGMLMIGVALSQNKRLSFSPKMIAYLFSVKFVLWPALALSLITLDILIWNNFDPYIYLMGAIYATVPLAGNPVAYAAQLGLKTQGLALAVLVSTLFALLYMPFILSIMSRFGIFPYDL